MCIRDRACILTASLAGCGGNTAGGNSGTADALATQEQGSAAVESAGSGETKDAPVDIPQPDPDERYSISYTGMWSGADYEDGSYICLLYTSCCGLNRKGTGGRMVYAGIIALIFIGELFIKNHVEKNRKDGEEKEILQGRILLRKYHNKGCLLYTS